MDRRSGTDYFPAPAGGAPAAGAPGWGRWQLAIGGLHVVHPTCATWSAAFEVTAFCTAGLISRTISIIASGLRERRWTCSVAMEYDEWLFELAAGDGIPQ